MWACLLSGEGGLGWDSRQKPLFPGAVGHGAPRCRSSPLEGGGGERGLWVRFLNRRPPMDMVQLGFNRIATLIGRADMQ